MLLSSSIKQMLGHLPFKGQIAQEVIFKQILNNEQEQAGREAREKGPMVEKEEVILGKTYRLDIKLDHHGV